MKTKPRQKNSTDQSQQVLRKFGKLVRRDIPANLRKKGLHVVTRRAGRAEQGRLLLAKVEEELREVAEATRAAGRPREKRAKLVEEFGDTLQALRDLARHHGVKWSAVKLAREVKLGERGGFDGGVILVSTEGVAHRRERLKKKGS